MDLVTFLRVLLRRWDVVLPGLLLTLVTVMAAGTSVDPEYEAEGSVLLLGPSTSTSSQGAVAVNPYLSFNSSLESSAAIVAESMSSGETVRELADAGATAGYKVSHTQKTPILTVSARGPSKELVLYTADLVLQRLQEDLATRQEEAGAPAATLIRSQVLSPPRAAMHAGNRPRVMTAVGAVGLGTTIMLAFAVESLATWRNRQRQQHTPPASVGPVFAGFPYVSAEPAPHLGAEWEPAEAAQGNGWHQHPPSGPLVDVVPDTAGPSPAEDPYEAEDPYQAEDSLQGETFEEVLPHNDVPAQNAVLTQNEVPARNGNLEQQDGLVEAWWSAWERRQAGRRGAQDPMEPTAFHSAEEWTEEAPEAVNEYAATSSPREVRDVDEEGNPRLDEDLRGHVDQADNVIKGDEAESLLAWGGIEVLGGTAPVEPEAVNRRPFLPEAGGPGSADESDT